VLEDHPHPAAKGAQSLDAQGGDVVRLVVRQGLALVAVALAVVALLWGRCRRRGG